jgi:aarF domain-containing kinase
VRYIRILFRLIHTISVALGLGIRCCVNRSVPTPALLAGCFARLGATYIKLGQFIASSPSVFPRAYVNECYRFLDQVEPISFARILKVLQAEFGNRLQNIFTHIDPEPLASASIAQVHTARLTSGAEVVLKILKPGVAELIQTDLFILNAITRVLFWVKPVLLKTELKGILTEMEDVARDECDFLVEARRIEHFNQFLKNNRIAEVVVPNVYNDLTTKRVLVMERFYGIPLSSLTQKGKTNRIAAKALHWAMRVWLVSVSCCDFFHADIHPGNMFLLEDGNIGLIDFGIVGRIKQESWQSMLKLLSGLQRGKFFETASAMVDIGSVGNFKSDNIETTAIAEDLEKVFGALPQDRMTAPKSIRTTSVEEVISGVAEIGLKYNLRFPREMFLILKQYIYFDFSTQILSM